MIRTGSKLLLGATVLATIAAVAYGISNGGSLGTTGLISAAVVLATLSAINLYTNDSDVSSMDATAATESAAARPAPPPSLWPAVGALGALLVVLGLVSYPVVFVFGIISLLAATIEWMIAAWSERASGDDRFNTRVRQRFAHAYEFPVLAALTAAIVVYSFSRIMLFLSKTGGPVAFGLLAALVLTAGFLIALRPQVRNATVSAVAGIAVVGLVAGGAAAALAGEREMHHHETTSELAHEGECDTAEETEADENASQSVAAKANLAGSIILREDGTLIAQALGIRGEDSSITITRSNPTNIRFRNESNEERRLVLNFGERDAVDEQSGEEIPDSAAVDEQSEDERPEGAAADEQSVEEVPDERVPNQLCTQLVEEGGSQMLTFTIGQSSATAGTPFSFTVPGVEGQSVEVIVP